MRASTPLEAATDLLLRGYQPIPVPHLTKAPRLPGWLTLVLGRDDLPAHFNGAPSNIGILLGERAGGIVDVDLDHPIAVELASKYLPPTGARWGRTSNPRSHWSYRTTRPVDTQKWQSKSAGMLLELRSTGCQTLAPGSTHPSGELVRWDDDGEPADIDPDVLRAALERLALAVRAELGETPPAKSHDIGTARRRATNYGASALEREAEAVTFAPEGARNDTLNRAAFNVGTLVGAGELDRREAEARLLHSALRCGLPDDEARRTIQSGLAAGESHPRSSSPTQRHGGTARPQFPFSPVNASELIERHPELRPVVIDGLLRRGETLNVVAAPKAGKSWLVHSLAVAVAAGQRWLAWRTEPGRVLLIDGELHPETLARRLRLTAEALGAARADLEHIDVWTLRGDRQTVDSIADALEAAPHGPYSLIVLDALYRFLPEDGEENANETMTRVYNALDAIAAAANAAVVVVHHASKGNQSDKAVTDVGSGAGAQSRAADSHLILREHEEEGGYVVEAVVRSFPPVDAFAIRSTRPGWALAPELDPAQLRRGRRNKPAAAVKEEQDPIAAWTPERFASDLVRRELLIKDDVVARARAQRLGKAQAETLLRQAEDRGLVHRHKGNGNEPHRFSIEPPAGLTGGAGSSRPPPPVLSAPGGVGGTE